MTRVVVSNCSLGGVRDAVRIAALEDFGYFANVVFGTQLSDEFCEVVQNALARGEDAVFKTSQSQKLGAALCAWLNSHGVAVLGVELPKRHDLLSWLEMGEQKDPHRAVNIRVREGQVELEWL